MLGDVVDVLVVDDVVGGAGALVLVVVVEGCGALVDAGPATVVEVDVVEVVVAVVGGLAESRTRLYSGWPDVASVELYFTPSEVWLVRAYPESHVRAAGGAVEVDDDCVADDALACVKADPANLPLGPVHGVDTPIGG